MKWNWQHKDWPKFTYDAAALDALEAQFLHESGILQGMLKHVSEDDKTLLIVDVISDEAVKTSEIEGEFLSRDSVQSSIRRQFGLSTDGKNIPAAEQGIAELMVDVYQSFDQPLTHKMLFNWHGMIMKGRRDLKNIGQYRTHKEPMQVVSGAIHAPVIHFEAPPSSTMKAEMAEFIRWFNATAPKQSNVITALARAAIAHLYFECIHPFEDGNGRIGRALAEKSLSQSLARPTLIALSHEIERHKKTYYQALERNNKTLDITDWMTSFAETILAAQNYSQRLIDFLINKTKLYDRLRGQLNERQDKAISRLFREGPKGFKGGLSAENYISITRTSRATATRDLQDLVEKGALRRTGERRYTRYYLNI